MVGAGTAGYWPYQSSLARDEVSPPTIGRAPASSPRSSPSTCDPESYAQPLAKAAGGRWTPIFSPNRHSLHATLTTPSTPPPPLRAVLPTALATRVPNPVSGMRTTPRCSRARVGHRATSADVSFRVPRHVCRSPACTPPRVRLSMPSLRATRRDQFPAELEPYVTAAVGAIVVTDATAFKSSSLKKWKDLIDRLNPVPTVLVTNKCDLVDQEFLNEHNFDEQMDAFCREQGILKCVLSLWSFARALSSAAAAARRRSFGGPPQPRSLPVRRDHSCRRGGVVFGTRVRPGPVTRSLREKYRIPTAPL